MGTKRSPIFILVLVLLVFFFNPMMVIGADSFIDDQWTKVANEPGGVPIEYSNGLINFGTESGLNSILTGQTLAYSNPPYLSEDGKTLYNANLSRILVADQNPEMQNFRFPQALWIEDAVSGRSMRTATFDIIYNAAGTLDPWGAPCRAFPESAKAAFSAAAAIWANLIQSSVPITISACWSSELGTGILGYSGGGLVHRNFSSAPKANTWYMSSLANSFAGTDLNDTYADMYITYSSTFDWYYGTDGMTPSGLYDLVTVAAHEIAHGLNFSGIMDYSGGVAEYGLYGTPSIFEPFMESGGGIKLTSYTNPSTALSTLVTSNDLYWNGPNANAGNEGARVKMYAPSTWSSGSSYSHLDYDKFAGTINSMMVYAIGSGSSQHNPGPVTQGILKDMGWVISTTPEEPPSAPTGVYASDGDFIDKVRVSWNALSDATYYKVYRNTSSTTTGSTELTGSHASISYDDLTATPGTEYYYWVKACNSAGCSDYSNADSGYALEIPAPPTEVTATDNAFSDRVQISWNLSDGATYYMVYKNNSNTTVGAVALEGFPASSPYNDFDVIHAETYYYWVKGCNLVGCSDFSSVDSGYAASTVSVPSPPSGVLASDGTYTDKVRISWTETEGAAHYEVYRTVTNSPPENDAIPLMDEILVTTYDDYTTDPNQPYYYWVKACNQAGCSEYSDSDQGWREVYFIYLPLIFK